MHNFRNLKRILFFTVAASLGLLTALAAEDNKPAPAKETAESAAKNPPPASALAEPKKEKDESNPHNIFEEFTEGITGHSGKIELETNADGQIQDRKDTVKQTVNKFIFNDKHLGISGYMDTFSATSFNNPSPNTRRPYNSNPEYVNEFGMSYGYISFEYLNENARARIALQGGEIVERMYIGERDSSGVKHFREANAGYAFSKHISLDMGIFPSFYGAEGFINKDNQHATRAIMTDFAPDYTAGLRLNYDINDRWELKLEVTNGWQNLTNPHQKAFGGLLIYKLADKLLLNYATYLGNEALVGSSMVLRSYHNFFTKIFWKDFTFLPMVDYFFERRDAEDRTVYGVNAGMSVRYAINRYLAIAGRYEHLYDPEEIIPDLAGNAPYGVPNMLYDGTKDPTMRAHAPGGFQADGYTLTFEFLPSTHITVRVEGRYTRAYNAIYIRGNNQPTNEDSFIYTSVAVGF